MLPNNSAKFPNACTVRFVLKDGTEIRADGGRRPSPHGEPSFAIGVEKVTAAKR